MEIYIFSKGIAEVRVLARNFDEAIRSLSRDVDDCEDYDFEEAIAQN